jgi:hypothetical protein
MALSETKPFAWSFRIVEASALARASAARAPVCPLLVLPLPGMNSASRVSILTTVVYRHPPPRTVGISLRFNSSASDWRETKPSALSSRRVEAKARARASAARLLASGPLRIPRLRDAVVPRNWTLANHGLTCVCSASVCSNLNISDHARRLCRSVSAMMRCPFCVLPLYGAAKDVGDARGALKFA